MRAITQQSIEAFVNGMPFNKANMKVEINGNNVFLYLHGNMIANREGEKLFLTTCGWETNTTKERLNGVLSAYNLPKINQSKGIWYIDKQEFNGCKNFKI